MCSSQVQNQSKNNQCKTICVKPFEASLVSLFIISYLVCTVKTNQFLKERRNIFDKRTLTIFSKCRLRGFRARINGSLIWSSKLASEESATEAHSHRQANKIKVMHNPILIFHNSRQVLFQRLIYLLIPTPSEHCLNFSLACTTRYMSVCRFQSRSILHRRRRMTQRALTLHETQV